MAELTTEEKQRLKSAEAKKKHNTKRTQTTTTRRHSTRTNRSTEPAKNYDTIGSELNQEAQKTKQKAKDTRQTKKTAQREVKPSAPEQEKAEMKDALVQQNTDIENKAVTKIQSLARAHAAKKIAAKEREWQNIENETGPFALIQAEKDFERVVDVAIAQREAEKVANREKPSLVSRVYNAISAAVTAIGNVVSAIGNVVTAPFKQKEQAQRPKYQFAGESALLTKKTYRGDSFEPNLTTIQHQEILKTNLENLQKNGNAQSFFNDGKHNAKIIQNEEVTAGQPIIAEPIPDDEKYNELDATEVTATPTGTKTPVVYAQIVETEKATPLTEEKAKKLIQASNVRVVLHGETTKNLLKALPIQRTQDKTEGKNAQQVSNKRNNNKQKPIDSFSI